MAQLIVAAAGAALGWAVGGPVGAQIGFALFSFIGAQLFQSRPPPQPLTDLRISGTEYGQPFAYIRGRVGVAGQIIWNTDRIPTTTDSGGGKGGTPTQSSTTYSMDLLIKVSDNLITGIGRVWDNGKLVSTNLATATALSISASEMSDGWDRMTVYTGDDAQMPDPDYEAAVGAANAPAYRGCGTIFIKGLKLGASGALKNLVFEVFADGSFSSASVITPVLVGTSDNNLYATPNSSGALACLPLSGTLWCCHYLGPILLHAIQLIDMSSGDVLRSFANSTLYATSYDVPHATMADNSVIVGGKEFTRINRLLPDGTNYILDTAAGNGYYGMIVDGADLWGFNSLMYRVSGINWAGNICTDTPVTGANVSPNVFVSFAFNACGISGRVYYRNSSSTVSYVNKGTMTAQRPATNIPMGITRVFVVGYDGYLYVPDGSLKKYDPDGNFIAACVIPSLGSAFLQDHLGFVWCQGALSGVLGYYKVDGATMTIGTFVPRTNFNTIGYNSENIVGEPMEGAVAVDGDLGLFTGVPIIGTTASIGIIPFTTHISPDSPLLSEVVYDLCIRAGLIAGQIDVSLLLAQGKVVDSMALSQIAPTRSPLEELSAVYYFECLARDKLYFVPRGGASALSIPFSALGARDETASPVDPLELLMASDIEVPAQIALSYINIDNDYQTDTQSSDRLISTVSGSIVPAQVALGLTAAVARGTANTILLDKIIGLITSNLTLLGDYCALEPTDIVTVTAADGTVFNFRIPKRTDSFPVMSYALVMESVSSSLATLAAAGFGLITTSVTSSDYSGSSDVEPPSNTDMLLLDGPIVRDEDNDSGLYAVAKGDSALYAGSAIFSSPDDANYSVKAVIRESAIFGTCTTILTNWTGPRIFDEISSVTVDVGDGVLASTTRDLILNDKTVNAMLIGSEVIQFRLAAFISDGVYKLTGLLRGLRGTEWAMTGHASSERAVLLRGAGARRISMTATEINLSRYYKGVTLGRALSTATAQSFTNTAIGLKPFSPVDLRGSRDGSNNLTGTFMRRTRLATRIVGGIYVPLGEDIEAYDIDVYALGSPNVFLRTISVTSPTFLYSAADQTSDGITPGDHVFCQAYQISGTVGRGYVLEGTI